MTIEAVEMLSVRAAAKLLAMSTRTVRRYCERGDLRGERGADGWTVSKAEVDRYVAARRSRTLITPGSRSIIRLALPAERSSLDEMNAKLDRVLELLEEREQQALPQPRKAWWLRLVRAS